MEILGLVTIMRKLLFVVLALVLVLNLRSGRSEVISNPSIPLAVYQGDLILNGDNVTVIEGNFEINGSIIIESNATLILRNGITSFTQVGTGIYMQNPANGNPRFQAENGEIVGVTDNRFYGNGSATFSNFTTDSYFYCEDETNMTVLDSRLGGFQARDYSTAIVTNSTLQQLNVVLFSGNATLVDVSPGFFSYWDFQTNCSVVLGPQTMAPQVTLSQTSIGDNWGFSFQGACTATVANSTLSMLHVNLPTPQSGNIYASDSFINTVELYYEATVTLTNVTYLQPRPFQNSEINVYWYLDTHVIDDSPPPGQDVEGANVIVTFPNGTLAGQALTGADGSARFTLKEKMTNATDDYPVGTYSVNATFLSYSNYSAVDMVGNQAITLILEGFVVPEFPSFLTLPLFLILTLLAGTVYKKKRSID